MKISSIDGVSSGNNIYSDPIDWQVTTHTRPDRDSVRVLGLGAPREKEGQEIPELHIEGTRENRNTISFNPSLKRPEQSC